MSKQTVLPPTRAAEPSIEAQIAAMAKRYKDARGLGVQLLGLIGTQADGLIERLPGPVRQGLETATISALEVSFATAARSRGVLPDTGNWLTRAVTMGTGAAGGFGGLPSALAELPVTTTVILRAIQGIAAEHGFDPTSADTRAECLQVFGAAGPMGNDDGTDLSFLTLRLSVTGASLQAVLAKIAPKLSVVLGQKLATQTVPVLGAVAGAATNYVFTSYYQEMAHIQFSLRKLAEETGHDRAELIGRLETAIRS